MNISQKDVLESIPLSDFLESELGRKLFCSRSSYDWFCQKNRQVIKDHCAAFRIGGKVFVHPEKMALSLAAIANNKLEGK